MLTEELEVGNGIRGLRTLVGRACGLDATALARVRQFDPHTVEVFLSTPFQVFASRRAEGTCQRDGAVVTARNLLAALDDVVGHDPSHPVPLAPQRLNAGPAQDPFWPGALPPKSDFELVEEVPVKVVRKLSDEGKSLARQFSGPLGPPDSLLRQSVLSIDYGDSQVHVPMRMIFACTNLGLVPGFEAPSTIPRHLRISTAGRWVRVDAPYGTVYHSTALGIL
ncbi:hypothetical protein GP475_09540 [Corynebacterium poyangense]|uniref:Uncharacterized protein n=1 Tax=Corynebacterium poyangense TaxID=2684405 RepID=A0A7H0SQN2_9CORY|nr:hypothetical protein [Corynebacterium poyangense]QNQ90857.1 hypothetical protein GP475_09540 [Corynebacterium poyangense]